MVRITFGRALLFAVLTAGLAVAYIWRPEPGSPSICMMKNLLKVGCPGCGLTRSVTAAAHGAIGEAFRWHLFGPVFLAIALAVWGSLAAEMITTRAILPDLSTGGWSKGLIGMLVALIAYWVVRAILGATP